MNLFEPKTYSKKLGELINAVPFFSRGELIRTSELSRILRVAPDSKYLVYGWKERKNGFKSSICEKITIYRGSF